jgi:hypothetical protein
MSLWKQAALPKSSGRGALHGPPNNQRFGDLVRMKATSIFAVILFICVAACLYTACKPVWQFDHLEQSARRVITATELQTWATNLLARYPTNTDLRVSELGTNFPQRLRDLAPKLGPSVVIFEGDDTNSPSWVFLRWGSGFLGSRGFEIGPTNFVSGRPGHVWQPGVYFFDR